MAISAFVADASAGDHVVDLFCTETDGDLDWSRSGITVTAAPIG